MSLQKDRCLSFVNKLWEADTLAMFHHPVSATEVPGYYDVIKVPIDLSTIRKKIEESTYTQDSDVEDDVALMISNALQFNEKGSPYYRLAQQLRKKYAALAQQSGLSFDADGAFIPSKKARDDESTLRKAEKKIEEKLGEVVEHLEKDKEIPIDELRAMYKRAKLEKEESSDDDDDNKDSEQSSGEEDSGSSSGSEEEDEESDSDDDEDDEDEESESS